MPPVAKTMPAAGTMDHLTKLAAIDTEMLPAEALALARPLNR